MAHLVRPDSYVEINNFYTVTIYETGCGSGAGVQHNLHGQSRPYAGCAAKVLPKA